MQNPTIHLCILMPAPFWHLICINFLQLLKRNNAETASSNDAIWDEFNEQN